MLQSNIQTITELKETKDFKEKYFLNQQAANLKSERERLNFSQEELSELLDVSNQTISLSEREKNFLSIIPAIKFCFFLNYSLDWLFGLSKQKYRTDAHAMREIQELFSFKTRLLFRRCEGGIKVEKKEILFLSLNKEQVSLLSDFGFVNALLNGKLSSNYKFLFDKLGNKYGYQNDQIEIPLFNV